MRSFQQVLVFLFAFLTFALAQEYDATVYVTSTVYKVNTITVSGTPTASVANVTSTIPATHATVVPVPVYPSGNGTAPIATGTGANPAPSTAPFTGAASSINVNSAMVAALAAGLGYLVL
ncbi:hypothetical protein BS50DRAFT_582168 [Corynespora cassiicola Philippines]|uniref:Uncharacterized protein n=1 Tax=Corynespora cassiicola Philippines TaxID=1448308 RepID=A0A2T2PD66_CORCC|nr:hypothetical protein BS50DRAFT_582168 [Corynespora cassiicola Philippines]